MIMDYQNPSLEYITILGNPNCTIKFDDIKSFRGPTQSHGMSEYIRCTTQVGTYSVSKNKQPKLYDILFQFMEKNIIDDANLKITNKLNYSK